MDTESEQIIIWVESAFILRGNLKGFWGLVRKECITAVAKKDFLFFFVFRVTKIR